MNANIAAILYLVSGVLFILALRGLSSSPTTSQAGNRNGMIGMAIAVGHHAVAAGRKLDPLTIGLILGGVVIGGGIGAVIARRVAMTSMPQLVAAFHSLVGMAACLVAVAAIYTPDAYGIGDDGPGPPGLADRAGQRRVQLRRELGHRGQRLRPARGLQEPARRRRRRAGRLHQSELLGRGGVRPLTR